ncbi:hypothetical protein [Desulfitobacterium metallireducens]|uniref:Uncharacterized protein n=1 Tax=Desulfitobacterium metallireducens DSM 15288 TaxID=871968 RepID=W0EAG6_9FIRM|nr:hypothetical protein [Desulfitobacterium metallireducens]AHF07742.1 hypothetical protein DESME_12470 [Desulfitobacterium metallireducens DSM 15288]
MPWMELILAPQDNWNEESLEDWTVALASFLLEKGEKKIKPQMNALPGYYMVALGENEELGELVISSAERLVILLGLSYENSIEKELAHFVTRFARQMGAVALRVPILNAKEKTFWKQMGANFYPDPTRLDEEIQREQVGVELLHQFSLQVTYKQKPALCLEPIFCNARAEGVVSLAQRRAERSLGGQPIGFASRISAHCPWKLDRSQWNDLLSFSRLVSFEVLEQCINNSEFS